jgi:hypothetical protein
MALLKENRGLNGLKCTPPILSGGLCLMMLGANIASAQQVKQPWKAPASATTVKNPVKRSPAALKDAQQLYQKNCVICHGNAGASNGPAAGSLPQKSANFTDMQMMKNATDGELFWKMTTGRAPHAVLAGSAVRNSALGTGDLPPRPGQERPIQIPGGGNRRKKLSSAQRKIAQPRQASRHNGLDSLRPPGCNWI